MRVKCCICQVFNELPIELKGTLASCPRENCLVCNKREEFIGTLYTAAKQDVHPLEFMKKVLKNEILAIGS
ncbi:hypothetical protein BGW38_002605, partial [Lunasporangiospora selenospora]